MNLSLRGKLALAAVLLSLTIALLGGLGLRSLTAADVALTSAMAAPTVGSSRSITSSRGRDQATGASCCTGAESR